MPHVQGKFQEAGFAQPHEEMCEDDSWCTYYAVKKTQKEKEVCVCVLPFWCF